TAHTLVVVCRAQKTGAPVSARSPDVAGIFPHISTPVPRVRRFSTKERAPLEGFCLIGYPPIALAVSENTLLALPPTSRIMPTTITRMTASRTAYSAMSWPWSSDQTVRKSSFMGLSPFLYGFRRSVCGDGSEERTSPGRASALSGGPGSENLKGLR